LISTSTQKKVLKDGFKTMLASLRVLLLAVLASKATAFLPASAHLARRQAVAFAPAPSPPAAQVILFFVGNC
jgi:hypothetical protein